eukprot:TRINITY_DN31107_c0_g1_i1.p1 TRINITY_DN31107_c0_g1~~TRINITY_DN31107_c0_g1_i1.p1  ORF type:complete len:265 (+),score=60.62 TRINITY_DN31107_c0_g1_i1:93-887(+)
MASRVSSSQLLRALALWLGCAPLASGIALSPTALRADEHDAKRKQIKVACVGDSITEGWTAYEMTDGYPAHLQQLLGKDFLVSNFGSSGRTMIKDDTRSYWLTGNKQLALTGEPDIVVLMLGTNDAMNANAVKTWEMLKDEYHRDYLDLVDEFKSLSSHPIILLGVPPPMFLPTGKTNARNATLINEDLPIWIEDIAKETGLSKPIRLDLAWREHCPDLSGGPDACDWTDDFKFYVHPNRLGFDQLAEVVQAAVLKAAKEAKLL